GRPLPAEGGSAGVAGVARLPGGGVRRPVERPGALGVRGRERPGLRLLEERARRMNPERLDPKRTCLLLFDFLVGHAAKDPQRYAPVLANAAQLLAAPRASGTLV